MALVSGASGQLSDWRRISSHYCDVTGFGTANATTNGSCIPAAAGFSSSTVAMQKIHVKGIQVVFHVFAAAPVMVHLAVVAIRSNNGSAPAYANVFSSPLLPVFDQAGNTRVLVNVISTGLETTCWCWEQRFDFVSTYNSASTGVITNDVQWYQNVINTTALSNNTSSIRVYYDLLEEPTPIYAQLDWDTEYNDEDGMDC